MSDAYGWSTHYSYFPGLDTSEVDHLLVGPKTTWRGYRAVTPTFDLFDEVDDVPEAELYDEFASYDPNYAEGFGYVGVPDSIVEQARIFAEAEADGTRSLREGAWNSFYSGQAGREFGRKMGSRLAGAKARVNPSTNRAYFMFRARMPGAHVDSIRRLAAQVADEWEVDVSVYHTNAGVYITFYEDLPQRREKMGRLYPARQNARLEPSGSADPGLILSRSGSSGMRGARDPYASSLLGVEAAPKPAYTRYGSNQSRLRWGSVEYEGPAIGAAVLGVGALAVLYRAVGGDPIF
jgi:hypothetical protein